MSKPAILDLILNQTYPIGSIYMSVNSVNPGTIFGGTWVSWGTGKVPVGIDTSQAEFNSIEKTGGEKLNSQIVCTPFNKNEQSVTYGLSGGFYADRTLVRTTKISDSHAEVNAEISNLQPYITCYMWKRTA